MSLNLNDVITYGDAKFKVVKIMTSKDVNDLSNALSNNIIPIGTILSYSVNSLTPPVGFLFCDGSAVSRTLFPDLFFAISTTYGSGDGETTFNLPNLTSGEFLEGSNNAGANKTPGLPNITGSIEVVQVNQASGAFTRNTSGYTWSASASNSYTKRAEFNASLSNSIYGNSTTVQPKAVTVKYIIKAFNSTVQESQLIDITQYANALNKKLDEHHLYEENFAVLYPGGGDESNPGIIRQMSKYIMNNPFPGYVVDCKLQIKYNNVWGEISGITIPDSAATGGYSVRGAYILSNETSIMLWTSNWLAINNSTYEFTFPSTTPAVSGTNYVFTAPARILVWKVGKINVD